MLHIKFQTSEQSGSEEEDFDFFYLFLCLNIGPPGAGPSCTQGPSLNKLGKGPLCNASYQTSSISQPSASEEEAF